MLIGRIPSYNAARDPERIALVDGARRISYGELAERSCRVANAFSGLGLRARDTAAVLVRNRAEFFEVLFGAAKLGVPVVPLNYRLSPGELAFALNDCRARLLVLASEFAPAVDSIRPNLAYTQRFLELDAPMLPAALAYEAVLTQAASTEPSETEVSADDCQVILYTSGTTGFPKGAMLSHANLFWGALNVRTHYPCAPGDACLAVLPLYHTASLNFSALPYLHAGATAVLLASYDAETTLALMQREGCRQTILLPQMWEDIAGLVPAGRLQRAKHLVCGGGETDPAAIARLQEATGGEYSLIMGMTEVGPLLCRLDPADVIRKNGSIGKPILSVSVEVVDDAFQPVPAGAVGEMVIRGPGVFGGYWNQPLATARSMTGAWFHSGDCVLRDEEGFLTIVDRKKDMIRSGGENIYSLEVERVLARHPAILEAAVIGLKDPDWGESVLALVVRRPGHSLDATEVIAWCRQHLASYKKPRAVRFLDSLPRNATGKVLKRELRQLAGTEGGPPTN